MPGQSQEQGGGAQQKQPEQPGAYQQPPARTRDPEPQFSPQIDPRSNTLAQERSAQKSGFKAEQAVSVKGRAGERSIAIEWIDTQVGNALSCRFEIRTAPGNALEAVIEQGAYRKTYAGSGTIGTQPVPVAPIGTKGRLIVQDTTTGETLEQPWTWYLIGGDELKGLWEKIKKFFWKSGA